MNIDVSYILLCFSRKKGFFFCFFMINRVKKSVIQARMLSERYFLETSLSKDFFFQINFYNLEKNLYSIMILRYYYYIYFLTIKKYKKH